MQLRHCRNWDAGCQVRLWCLISNVHACLGVFLPKYTGLQCWGALAGGIKQDSFKATAGSLSLCVVLVQLCWWLILINYKPILGRFNLHISACILNIFTVTWYTFAFFHSEHASFPDYKRGRGQCRTDCVFSLHRQWTQKGQLPPLASGEFPLGSTADWPTGVCFDYTTWDVD